MNGQPRLTFLGDKKKAQSFKGQALAFWQTVKNQPLNQGLNTVTRTKNLDNGITITAQVNKNAYHYSGFVSIFVPILEEQTNQTGFYYSTTSAPLKALASNANGFLPPDEVTTDTAYGMVDWTNHQETLITWRGAHRYCPPIAEELKVFNKKSTLRLLPLLRANTEFQTKLTELGSIIDDVKIAGCALKNAVYLVFLSITTPPPPTIFHTNEKLYFIFIDKLGILAQGELTSYRNYLQTIVISPDCTKAATIAYKERYETDVIEMTITLDTINSVYTVQINTITNQIVPFDYQNHGNALTQINYNNIIIAIDYLPNNTIKTFLVSGDYTENHFNAEQTHYNITTNFNNVITTGYIIDFHVVSDNLVQTVSTANTIIINDLDLRHDLFSYIEYKPDNLPQDFISPTEPSFTYTFFTYTLHLRTITESYTIVDVNSFNFFHKIIQPQQFALLNPFWLSVQSNTPLIPDRIWTQDFINPFQVVRTGISLFDRYENALYFTQPIKTIYHINGEDEGFFDYYFKKTIQIDNSDHIFSNTIVDLKGIV